MDLDSPCFAFIIERDFQRSVPAKQPATAINSKDQQKDSDGAGCLQSSHFQELLPNQLPWLLSVVSTD